MNIIPTTLENKIFVLTIFCLCCWGFSIFMEWDSGNTKFIGDIVLILIGALAGVYSKGRSD